MNQDNMASLTPQDASFTIAAVLAGYLLMRVLQDSLCMPWYRDYLYHTYIEPMKHIFHK